MPHAPNCHRKSNPELALREPTRHFRFDANNEITNTIDAGRRDSSYFLPIAAPKKKAAPGLFDTIQEKKAESGHVNSIRNLVKGWRNLGWPDITPVTRALLEHWHAEDRFRPLFFCQIEALETLIFITDPNNYYKELDIVPVEYRGDLGTARVAIVNFHAFKLREKGDAGGLTKRVLTANTLGAFTESPDEMVNRVCKDLGQHREIMAINDEAHHCYRSKPDAMHERMTREEASEAKAREEEARLWITGLEAVHKKIGVKAAFDLSATPFYLKGSGYPEGTLFPWVVSDFSLMKGKVTVYASQCRIIGYGKMVWAGEKEGPSCVCGSVGSIHCRALMRPPTSGHRGSSRPLPECWFEG